MGETAGQVDAARRFAWYGRRVLVTGATGFIGSRLVSRLLEMGAVVHGLVYERLWHLPAHPNLYQPEGDIRNRSEVSRALAMAEPETVFHLAALTQVKEVERTPDLAFEVNVGGTVNLLDCLRTMGLASRVVVASSDKAFGEVAEVIGPGHPGNPIHPYDASKAAVDVVVRSYAEFYKMDATSVRTANVYGPGDRQFRRIIPGTFWSLLNDQRPQLRSDGTPIREYLYVDDCVEAYVRAAEATHSSPHPIVVSGDRISVSDLVSGMIAISGKALQPYFTGEPFTETPSIMLDGGPSARYLGEWQRMPLADGLKATFQWLSELKAVADESKEAWGG